MSKPTPSEAAAPRPRLTGRAAILVMVLAVLAVSYASSLRAYLQQRDVIERDQATIAASKKDIAELEAQKDSFDDPSYLRAQARKLGYVMIGETPFVVTRDGKPLAPENELVDPDSIAKVTPPAWYDDAWGSVKLAGNPPKQTRPPLTEIDGRSQR